MLGSELLGREGLWLKTKRSVGQAAELEVEELIDRPSEYEVAEIDLG